VFEREFCDPASGFRTSRCSAMKTAACAFARMASSNADFQVLHRLEFTRKDFYAARRSRCADTFQGVSMPRKRRVPKYGDFCRPRNGVKKQLKPLFPQAQIRYKSLR